MKIIKRQGLSSALAPTLSMQQYLFLNRDTKRYNTLILLFVIFFLFHFIIIASAQEKVPRAVLQETQYDFGTVTRGVKVQSTIPLRNDGDADLIIREMSLSLPAMTVKAKSVIPPGNETKIALELDTAGLTGDVQGDIVLHTNDPEAPELKIKIKGHVRSLVEILPRPAIFLSAFRWEVEKKEAVATIENKDESPLKINGTQIEGEDRFIANLTTIEEGQRYKLSVKLRSLAPAVKAQGRITLNTNKGEIGIPVFTFLKNKVYVNPPDVIFGRIDLKQLEVEPDLLKFLTQTVFIYNYKGQDFQIQTQSSLPFISIEKTPKEGPGAIIQIPQQEGSTSVFELAISPIKEKLKPGKFQGTIRVFTNDKEFPELIIPVVGEVI